MVECSFTNKVVRGSNTVAASGEITKILEGRPLDIFCLQETKFRKS